MGKRISVVVSAIVGAGLAIVAAWGVISSNTAAPSQNPVGNQIVDYGQK